MFSSFGLSCHVQIKAQCLGFRRFRVWFTLLKGESDVRELHPLGLLCHFNARDCLNCWALDLLDCDIPSKKAPRNLSPSWKGSTLNRLLVCSEL